MANLCEFNQFTNKHTKAAQPKAAQPKKESTKPKKELGHKRKASSRNRMVNSNSPISLNYGNNNDIDFLEAMAGLESYAV